jgi:GNAT superfamily N-acetyltransferase
MQLDRDKVRAAIDWHALDGARHIRGFNYQPSWGRNGVEIWGHFDPERYRFELTRGLELFPGFNTVRLWLSWRAYKMDAAGCTRHVLEALDICASLGLLAIPTLFTRWVGDPPFDPVRSESVVYGDWAARFGPFIDAMVTPQVGNEAILAWDLCNEPVENAAISRIFEGDRVPDDVPLDQRLAQEVAWLTFIHDRVKRLDPDAATCVGYAWDLAAGRAWEPFSDLLTPHMYWYAVWCQQDAAKRPAFKEALRARVGATMDDWRTRGVHKPVVSTETCWGSLDDAHRAQIVDDTLSVLQDQGVGFLAHALWTSPVADLHPPDMGPVGGAGYMAFVESEGALRPQHEVIRRYLRDTPSYTTIFNPADEDLAVIDRGLHAYNLAHLGEEVIYHYHKVAILARDARGTVIGGIHGELAWTWLHIDTLWVDEDHRGAGVGSDLLARLEAAALVKGFYGAHLETTNFQARDFYLHHGYEVFGELEGKPEGVTWYYMKKRLGPATTR